MNRLGVESEQQIRDIERCLQRANVHRQAIKRLPLPPVGA